MISNYWMKLLDKVMTLTKAWALIGRSTHFQLFRQRERRRRRRLAFNVKDIKRFRFHFVFPLLTGFLILLTFFLLPHILWLGSWWFNGGITAWFNSIPSPFSVFQFIGHWIKIRSNLTFLKKPHQLLSYNVIDIFKLTWSWSFVISTWMTYDQWNLITQVTRIDSRRII